MSRHDIEAAAARFAPHQGAFLRRSPLWKQPGAAFCVACADPATLS